MAVSWLNTIWVFDHDETDTAFATAVGQVNGACVQNQVTCGNDFCGSTDNGVYTCSAADTCQLNCDTAGGYIDINGQCLNTQSDVNACGAVSAAQRLEALRESFLILSYCSP